MDATCAPSNIEYPQDTALLNEGREKLEKIIDELYDPKDGVKPRTYRKQAHKDYLKTARKRRKSAKDIRKAVGKQLRYIKRDFGYIDRILKQGKTLSPKQENLLQVLRTLYEQQLTMHQNESHQIADRFKICNYRQAYRLVFEYIEAFYNTKRIHSHCDYISPDDFEKLYEKAQKEGL